MPISRALGRIVPFAAALALASVAAPAFAAGTVVISQVYGGGGNTGAPYTNDYVELFNRSNAPIDVTGWSVQYASATGTGNFGANPVTTLPALTLQPGQYLLVQMAGGVNGVALPTPDRTGTVAMSATAGKVVLANVATGLACNGGSLPCSPTQLAQIVDLVGYGTANFFEGASAASAPANATAALRLGGGCTDTDSNGADFTVGVPAPRNSSSPLAACNFANEPVVASCPASLDGTAGVGAVANVSASDADGTVTSASIVGTAVAGISLQGIAGGSTLTAQLVVDAAAAAGRYPVVIRFANADPTPQVATCTVTVTIEAPIVDLRIHDVQGAAHRSPYAGQRVRVPGIVTARATNGFYLQDPEPDANPATSEALFVFTSSAPTVAVGDAIVVTGNVTEFRPGGASSGNLTLTEITSPRIVVESAGNTLPAPVVLGAGGRAIPTEIIDDDSTFDVETSGTFDAATDGLDFMESLEAMRVQVNSPVVVGPRNDFGEVPVLADGGAAASVRTPRGGIVIRDGDFNPERLVLDDQFAATPAANVGDALSSVVAVVDYSFGNYKLYVTAAPTVVDNALAPETTALVGDAARLSIASYNVENLAPSDPDTKFAAIAGQIVRNLRAPDVLSLIEIQDDTGSVNDGVVTAGATFAKLIAAIVAAGGPTYDWRDIAPVNNADGGEPGGNIRVGFLFNPARVTFVDRPGGTATNATTAVAGASGVQLSFSPGRVDPAQSAWLNSRKPLAGEFTFNGRTVFVVANHFNSKGGDDPLYGVVQPPVRSSETQRVAQAATVSLFVQSLRAIDPDAAVVVLGDLNDFQFSGVLGLVKQGSGLVNLVETLPPGEQYSYVFEGNSQSLDHLLVSPALATGAQPVFDAVHVNAEFAAQTSDHDPLVATLTLPLAGDVNGDGRITGRDVARIARSIGRAASGPFDPRDVNGDGRITRADVRLAAMRCVNCGRDDDDCEDRDHDGHRGHDRDRDDDDDDDRRGRTRH